MCAKVPIRSRPVSRLYPLGAAAPNPPERSDAYGERYTNSCACHGKRKDKIQAKARKCGLSTTEYSQRYRDRTKHWCRWQIMKGCKSLWKAKEANAKILTQEERQPAKGHALPCGENFLSVNVGTNSACGFGTEKTGWQMPHISATALFIPAPTKVGKSVDFHLTEYAKPR